jgi:hypothetical protein
MLGLLAQVLYRLVAVRISVVYCASPVTAPAGVRHLREAAEFPVTPFVRIAVGSDIDWPMDDKKSKSPLYQ